MINSLIILPLFMGRIIKAVPSTTPNVRLTAWLICARLRHLMSYLKPETGCTLLRRRAFKRTTGPKNLWKPPSSKCFPIQPTFGRVQALEGLRVGVDEVEVVLQPRHLALVPRRPQLTQTRDLVHKLLLLADPQRPEKISAGKMSLRFGKTPFRGILHIIIPLETGLRLM